MRRGLFPAGVSSPSCGARAAPGRALLRRASRLTGCWARGGSRGVQSWGCAPRSMRIWLASSLIARTTWLILASPFDAFSFSSSVGRILRRRASWLSICSSSTKFTCSNCLTRFESCRETRPRSVPLWSSRLSKMFCATSRRARSPMRV